MIHVRENQLEEAFTVSKQIPEFENLYQFDEYQKRLNVKHLILTAEIQEKPVGFKIGYERDNDSSFYSWMGGVLPKFRKQGVAEKLADYQEKWASENGYNSIKLKTRKKHEAMIVFSSKRGFVITKEISKIPEAETRICMEKKL